MEYIDKNAIACDASIICKLDQEDPVECEILHFQPANVSVVRSADQKEVAKYVLHCDVRVCPPTELWVDSMITCRPIVSHTIDLNEATGQQDYYAIGHEFTIGINYKGAEAFETLFRVDCQALLQAEAYRQLLYCNLKFPVACLKLIIMIAYGETVVMPLVYITE